MVRDAYITTYIVYIQYSILWVFTLFVGDFDYLIHILNIYFKSGLASHEKVILHLFLNVMKIEIVFKIHQISCFIY